MTGHPPATDAAGQPPSEALAERIESAVLEATRDLKGYYARELNTRLAQMEERLERRIANVESELQGINVKLVAIRDEMHQSLRDQSHKLAALGMSALALAVAALLLVTRWWR
jgi:DNA topoisomerase VI subunit B